MTHGFFVWERNVTYHCAGCRIFLASEDGRSLKEKKDRPGEVFSPGRRFYPIFSNRRAIISVAWSKVYLEVSMHRS